MHELSTNPHSMENTELVGSDAVLALAAAIRKSGNIFITKALERRGITDILPAHGAVLHALFSAGPLRMQDIALRIGKRKNTVTALINTLSARGYCCRETDRNDGRAQIVSLTEKGEGLRQIYRDISRELRQRIWRDIPADIRDMCADTLQCILRNLNTDAGE
ncbi:MAG: MarR family transcriptional regulator [Desulfovibrio sp.]|nr:MarR family transcriptional regulator [Desulfovibrio sp.]